MRVYWYFRTAMPEQARLYCRHVDSKCQVCIATAAAEASAPYVHQIWDSDTVDLKYRSALHTARPMTPT